MEIKFNSVNILDKEISFEIDSSGIYSFLGTSKSIKSLILDLISGEAIPESGNIQIKKNIKVGICKSNPYEMVKSKKIKDYFRYILELNNYKDKSINIRINQSLKLVGLDNELLDKKISKLSYIEAKKISLVSALIHNPRIIIIEDYTDGMVDHDKKEFARLIRVLKNKYKKIIIFLTKDTTFCYTTSDIIYLLDDKKIIQKGNKSILKNTNLLNKLGLEIPPIINFINECKKNNHELDEYNNILDLIKSIYREVK